MKTNRSLNWDSLASACCWWVPAVEVAVGREPPERRPKEDREEHKDVAPAVETALKVCVCVKHLIQDLIAAV